MRSTVPSTPTKTRRRKTRPSPRRGWVRALAGPAQQGQAIVLIGLLILVLFAMLGLAIDSGRAYVDRRDQQTAVDAAALAAGDWYENVGDVNTAVPNAVQLYENDLRLYSGPNGAVGHTTNLNFGPNADLQQDVYTYPFPGGYSLTVTATNTQFNGYQFVFYTVHQLPLAFMQIFGGPTTATINATATSIVGNQRQTPALLTLANTPCATNLWGNAQVTVLGDIYTNGTECEGASAGLGLAGNCYGQTGSACSSATYLCYNAQAGFIPYAPDPSCHGTDILGNPIVPAPTLPDPGYISASLGSYSTPAVAMGRGSYTEMTPGTLAGFSVNNGSGCFFLDPGIYTMNGGYTSDGGMVSNELKPPGEVLWSSPGTGTGPSASFWGAGGCDGAFNVSAVTVSSGNGMKRQGNPGDPTTGTWGIELTSVRYDSFKDGSIQPDPCNFPSLCRRESS